MANLSPFPASPPCSKLTFQLVARDKMQPGEVIGTKVAMSVLNFCCSETDPQTRPAGQLSSGGGRSVAFFSHKSWAVLSITLLAGQRQKRSMPLTADFSSFLDQLATPCFAVLFFSSTAVKDDEKERERSSGSVLLFRTITNSCCNSFQFSLCSRSPIGL
jgi:hypothetical protein